ncbi:hypothetical protein HacjB3_05600 [Halalkalicoccus jeotgali B3]|nr:hypothetical protein HacjB3_05600 [Halalkalicoccus jeotgali B3]
MVGAGPVVAQSNETTGVESPNASGNSSASDRVDSVPSNPTPQGGDAVNDSESESENATGGGSDTYRPEENDDSGIFPISIDPVGLLISFFEPWFTFGTDLLVSMAEALQSSTVYPMQDGSVAVSGEPDGDLMSILYEYWYGVSLVAGAAIWLIMTLVLYILGMVWPPTPTYQQIKIAQQEAWIKLLLIPFSWALGTIILFAASFAMNAVPLDPSTIAPDTSSIAANNAAAGISILLFYAFGGAFALAMAFTFFVTWLFLYVIFPAMPILIAMSVPKVWIMKGVAEAFEGVLELFPSAAFFPLPAVVVLSVGYSVLGAIENLLPGPAEWGAVPVSAVAIIVIWLLAFISSIYLFWFKRVGAGAGAIIAGSVGLGAISSALGRLGGGSAAGAGAAAGGAAGSGTSAAAGGISNAVNGHALGSGGSGTGGALGSGSSSSGLSTGGSDLASADTGASAPTSAGASTGTNPSGTALPGGSGPSPSSGPSASASASHSSSGTSSGATVRDSPEGRVSVDDPSITTVTSPDDLPGDQKYRAGYFTGSGPGTDIEFQKMLNVPRSSEMVTGETFKRVDDAYGERDLFVRGENDQQFYDVSEVAESDNHGLGLSEAEQNAESRSTVDNARGI